VPCDEPFEELVVAGSAPDSPTSSGVEGGRAGAHDVTGPSVDAADVRDQLPYGPAAARHRCIPVDSASCGRQPRPLIGELLDELGDLHAQIKPGGDDAPPGRQARI
jgi:hypothetical protein